jgi:hybrid cluster-associated redox disulfide protein
MKITRKTNMYWLLIRKPDLAKILISSGMGCLGCPMAQIETIEDGCKAHGMSAKEIDKLVQKLNKKIEKKKK